MPFWYQKNESLAHLSSIVAGRVVVRGGHRYYRVCCFFALRIALYSYIYCLFGRHSIELYLQSIHALLLIIDTGKFIGARLDE